MTETGRDISQISEPEEQKTIEYSPVGLGWSIDHGSLAEALGSGTASLLIATGSLINRIKNLRRSQI